MSVQQILNIDTSSLSEKFLKEIIFNADQYYFDKHFKIGQGVDFDKAFYFSKLENIICEDNCQLVDYIKKKLEGKLEELGVKCKSKKSLQELLRLVQHKTNCNSQTEALCNCIT